MPITAECILSSNKLLISAINTRLLRMLKITLEEISRSPYPGSSGMELTGNPNLSLILIPNGAYNGGLASTTNDPRDLEIEEVFSQPGEKRR